MVRFRGTKLKKDMRKIFILISTMSAVVLSSCIIDGDGVIGPRGPQGPEGPTGPQGAPGESGYVFEWENIDFTSPDYEVFLSFPVDFETYDSDVILVYFLWGTEVIDGEEVDVWRPLPQNIFTEFGLLQYNFDYTKYDIRIFLDGNFDLDLLGAIDTDDWIARVVVVPGNFWNSKVNFSDYDAVKEMLGLPDLLESGQAIKRR